MMTEGKIQLLREKNRILKANVLVSVFSLPQAI